MIAGSMRPIWSVCISDSSSSVEQKQKQYDRELERAIVERTKSYKEWEYEIDQAKRNIFKKYVSKMDETHPFMVDDYRMEVAKEMHRIDSFYEPIIQREADVLRAKRVRGLVSLLSPYHVDSYRTGAFSFGRAGRGYSRDPSSSRGGGGTSTGGGEGDEEETAQINCVLSTKRPLTSINKITNQDCSIQENHSSCSISLPFRVCPELCTHE